MLTYPTNQTEEVWKEITGYEGYYRVSNFGRIESLNYEGRGIRRILKTHHSSQEYDKVALRNWSTGKQTTITVHRIVATHFIPNPENLPQINHKDGDKYNNHVDNLEWCSPSENTLHAYRVLNKVFGFRCIKRKSGFITRKCRQSIFINGEKHVVAVYSSIQEAAEINHIDPSVISACCSGRANHRTSCGYNWEYADNVEL